MWRRRRGDQEREKLIFRKHLKEDERYDDYHYDRHHVQHDGDRKGYHALPEIGAASLFYAFEHFYPLVVSPQGWVMGSFAVPTIAMLVSARKIYQAFFRPSVKRFPAHRGYRSETFSENCTN